MPLQAAGFSSPEVFAAVTIAVRSALAAEMASATASASAPIVTASFPSVAAVPLQAACLSSRAVDLLSLGAGFLLFNRSLGSAR